MKRDSHTMSHLTGTDMGRHSISHVFLQMVFPRTHTSKKEMLGDQKVVKWKKDNKNIEKEKNKKYSHFNKVRLPHLIPFSPVKVNFSDHFSFYLGTI